MEKNLTFNVKVKAMWDFFFQNFVVFSEYLNFKTSNGNPKKIFSTVPDFFEHISHHGGRIDYQD